MSPRGYARMRDANEKPIVLALRAVGAHVTQLDGKGVPDLLVGFRGATHLLEVKLPLGKHGGRTSGGASRPGNGGDGTLTEAQVAWHAGWCGGRVAIVRTPDEALAAIGALDAAAVGGATLVDVTHASDRDDADATVPDQSSDTLDWDREVKP